MSYILILETSGESCSVSLADDDKIILSKERKEINSHAAHLTNLIYGILSATDLALDKITALAINGGPGSYTGLRVGASVAKGLCYSLSIPLIAVDGLKCLALAAIQKHQDRYSAYCASLNSRQNELYCTLYRNDNSCIWKSDSIILNDSLIHKIIDLKSICFVGSGAEKFRNLVLDNSNLYIDNEIIMSSTHLVDEVFFKYQNHIFESLIDFEPFYLKPVYIRKKLE